MKSNYLKWSGLSLVGLILMSSCMSDVDQPLAPVSSKAIGESTEVLPEGGENLRKGPKSLPYMEKFSNQSIQDPTKPYAFPGFGTGNALFMGKSYSFFNQYAVGAPNEKGEVSTVAAPVTEFFQVQIEALGISAEELDSNYKTVSTITTDGKGNSIWFHNVSNNAKFDKYGNITFLAEVEIVGGTGKFKGATGSGRVIGNVKAADGKGNTLLSANIIY
ncbi:hypothetical protein [Algoriphagus sp. A40]|uniref:hypothetical protein n=1 Tax=Algoriphagus sp. A40 TaxID=1945863 RepID=UPI0009858F75|nr:hypothetical protein [Algoriphagus sp. A40]OOG74870.1 hypothetical protein B0E43_10835 [Algoriphagus sp. A40]